MQTIRKVEESGIIAIIRGVNTKTALKLAEELSLSGIKMLEITMENPEALEVIKCLKKNFDALFIGAGTVLDPETARNALLAGANFIVSPNVNVETIKLTKRYGTLCISGALTPTEILKAYEHGADAVKIFPVGPLGPEYIKNLKGPFPHIPFIPTGGININNLADYLSNGAIAVGLGSSLVDIKNIHKENFYSNLREKAIASVKEVAKAKERSKPLE